MKKSFFSVVLSILILSGIGLAQGVTSAAFSGSVLDNESKPLPGATVKAVHLPTGSVFETVSREDGKFDLYAVRVGGPYSITATMTGFASETMTDITVKLGENRSVKFALSQERIDVGVTVTAPNPIISQSRTGAAQNVTTAVIETMPTIGRTFGDFARLSPQVDAGSSSFNAIGRNNKYNSIQIDGAVNNDLFGLGSGGTPGVSAPISLDAVQEFQLVVAPYDVRYGGFTGAGLNAITRYGTNSFSGSAYYFGRNQNFVGYGPDNYKYSDFSDAQAGLRIGGPIVKDKIFFFLSAEIGRRSSPTTYVINDSGASNDFGGASITVADAQRFVGILKNKYGYDPGGFGEGYKKPLNDNDKLFFRVDYNISNKHRLTLRHNYISGSVDNAPSKASSSVFAFGDDFYQLANTTNSTVLQLHSTLKPNLFNELIVNYTTIRDKREIPDKLFPQVNVAIAGGYRLTAGSEQYSGANSLSQDILEITDNLTWTLGDHMITLGTHNEFFKFANVYIRNLYGYWEFNSLDDFEIGKAARYYHDFYTADPARKWAAEFSVAQLGGYIGDKWSILPNLALTLGLRVDVPIINNVPTANSKAESVYGIKTDQAASGNVLWAPRFGFNWDVFDDKRTQVRGGIGIFAGRTPYVWISNQFGNSGMDLTRLDIRNPAFSFVADPLNQPFGAAIATTEVDYINKDFAYPSILRSNIAVDHELPFGFIGTVEFVYSKNINEILYNNLNLRSLGTTTLGGRPLFARDIDVQKTGSAFITDAIYLTNTSKGYQYTLSFQLQKNFANRSWISAYYTYGQSKDVNSGTSSQAASNFVYNNIRFNPNDPELVWSNFDVRHRIGIAFNLQFNFLKGAPTSLTMVYGGRSGSPYSTTYNFFDANGDAASGNDLVYVPASLNEVIFMTSSSSSATVAADQDGLWAAFNSFIQGDPGLAENRGKIVPRNASRLPWSHGMDLRLAQDLPVPALGGHALQLTVDIMNVLNMINRDWSRSWYISNQNDVPWTLQGSNYGVDPATGKQRIYYAPRAQRFSLSQLGSRWQIQVGVRYRFN